MKGSLWDRFWAKVDTSAGADDCWLWTGAKSRKRKDRTGWTYRGHIRIGRRGSRVVLSHRLVLCLMKNSGEDLVALLADYDAWFDDGTPRKACHACHVRLCCNPTHLYWGTSQQNHEDRYGRQEAVA